MVVKLSSTSSSSSISSTDELTKPYTAVKFLCSFNGRILPRYPDGRLRYVGGETRFLSVPRSTSFSDLRVKLGELCGAEKVNLRCKLPNQDLDALVTITSDEDLANLVEEYELGCTDRQSSLKIRAFLHSTPMKSPRSVISPVISTPPVVQSHARWVRSGRSNSNHIFNGFPGHGFPVVANCRRNYWQQ